MTNLKRIESNLLNAQHSTGPKTHKGKAIASMNAEKHGILSKETLINNESIHDLNEFAEAMKLNLAPEGQFEALLVDRIVSSAWRLRRIIRVEAQILDEKPEYDFDNSKILADSFKNEDGNRMSILSRYETTLEKSLYRALHELQRLQAQRRGQPVMPPMMLDVNISEDDGFVSQKIE